MADFHSLRSAYVTNLARAGVSVKALQLLVRHSTPTLTLGAYTTLGVDDLASAIESLPPATFAAGLDGAIWWLNR